MYKSLQCIQHFLLLLYNCLHVDYKQYCVTIVYVESLLDNRYRLVCSFYISGIDRSQKGLIGTTLIYIYIYIYIY